MKNELDRILQHSDLIKDLYETSKEKLGFKPDAKIVILTNEANSNNPLGKTAYYDPANHKIALYTNGRHIKDIMRSLSHELVHHSQNCRGDFDGGIATVDGYAQEDGHLREMEREAYETGNMIFRDWEDNYKSKNNNFGNEVMGEKLMENKETKLREMIRTLVQEALNDAQLEEGRKQAKPGAEEKAKENYEKNAKADEKHIEDLEKDKEYDERKAKANEELEVEELKENENTFFPEGRSIREKARQQTHEALMKRWGYVKKDEKSSK